MNKKRLWNEWDVRTLSKWNCDSSTDNDNGFSSQPLSPNSTLLSNLNSITSPLSPSSPTNPSPNLQNSPSTPSTSPKKTRPRPLPPGYQFEKLPDDWRCPTCGAAQSFFQSKSVQTPDRWVCAEPAIWAWWQFSHFGPEDSFYIRHLFFFSLFLGGYFLQ